MNNSENNIDINASQLDQFIYSMNQNQYYQMNQQMMMNPMFNQLKYYQEGINPFQEFQRGIEEEEGDESCNKYKNNSLTVIFREDKSNCLPIYIQTSFEEKVSDLIKKYSKISGYNDKSKKFILILKIWI